MVPQNCQVLAKLGFCSNYSQIFSGYLFPCARIFLQVLACSVFGEGSFLQSARCSPKLTFFNASACKEKRHVREDHSIPLTLTRLCTFKLCFLYNMCCLFCLAIVLCFYGVVITENIQINITTSANSTKKPNFNSLSSQVQNVLGAKFSKSMTLMT